VRRIVATIDTEFGERARGATVDRAGGETSTVSGPVLFATDGREPRRRRIADAALLGCALVALVLAGLASDATAAEQDLAAAFDGLLGWLEPLWTMSYAAASVVSAGLLLAAIAGRRTALARDIILAAAGALGTGWVVARSVDGDAPSLADMLWTSGDPSYPAVRVAIVSAVVVVAGPDLTRPARRAGAAVVGLAAMASVVLGSAYPSHVLGGLGLGFGVGAAVRLTFGSSAGFPTIDRVRSALHHLGVDAIDVRVAPRQGVGPARYIAESGQGSLAISVYGRDARDAQIVARVWRALWYRDPGPQASYTRREQVDHEALMLLLARRRADVLVADVVGVGSASTGDVVLVTLQPDAPTLADLPADELTDGLLAQVWAAAARLRGAGIGHGRLNAASILVADGEVLVTDLAAARMHAPAAVLATDLAELLVSCSLLVGEARVWRRHGQVSATRRCGTRCRSCNMPRSARACGTRCAPATRTSTRCGSRPPGLPAGRRRRSRSCIGSGSVTCCSWFSPWWRRTPCSVSSPTSGSTRSWTSSRTPSWDGCSSVSSSPSSPW
jgi:glycosyltransferase 2 family protein